MNQSDIFCKFTSTDVKCYYCAALLSKKKISGDIFSDVYVFSCSECKEKFYYGSRASSFSFTCKDLVCAYTYKKHTISISSLAMIVDSDAAKKFINNTVPAFEVNFTNKDKLYNKLKTYLSFS